MRIADLFLDPGNSRLEVPSKASQESVINDPFVNEDAMQILDSIVRNGPFPDELPVAIEDIGKFVVVEGNRRVAAFKAILRPELVASKEDEPTRSSFDASATAISPHWTGQDKE